MNNDDFVTHESRCLYENDEVMVSHAVMSFPDGTRESVLAYNQIKDGKIREKILKNSPQKNEEFFVVPKVVE